MTEAPEDRFLIIGGTSKAGTTSIFNYLAGHPQVCPSTAKETRFFLDRDYPLPSEMRFGRNELVDYFSFFPGQQGKGEKTWKLEATPDYLYSPGTARLIRQALPDARFIFSLREPVSRLFSFYRFGQQINEIPRKMSFDEYVDLQKNDPEGCATDKYRHPAFRSLRHGCYSDYLKPFVELFGRSSIHLVFYEELRRDPASVMKSICEWAGLDDAHFADFAYAVANKGVRMRSPQINRIYYKARLKARRIVGHRSGLRSILRRIGGSLNGVYRTMNVAPRDEVLASSATKVFLEDYYKREPGRLRKMLGIEAPWPKPGVREG